jgi:hypothetical protein
MEEILLLLEFPGEYPNPMGWGAVTSLLSLPVIVLGTVKIITCLLLLLMGAVWQIFILCACAMNCLICRHFGRRERGGA